MLEETVVRLIGGEDVFPRNQETAECILRRPFRRYNACIKAN